MADHLNSALGALAVVLAWFGLGRAAIAALGLGQLRLAETWVFSIACGLLLWDGLLRLLLVLGWSFQAALSPIVLLAALIGMACLAGEAIRLRNETICSERAGVGPRRRGWQPWDRSWAAAAGTAGLLGLMQALAPPLDATTVGAELLAAKKLMLLVPGDSGVWPDFGSTPASLGALGVALPLAVSDLVAAGLARWCLVVTLAAAAVVAAQCGAAEQRKWQPAAIALLAPGLMSIEALSFGTIAQALLVVCGILLWQREVDDRSDTRHRLLAAVLLVVPALAEAGPSSWSGLADSDSGAALAKFLISGCTHLGPVLLVAIPLAWAGGASERPREIALALAGVGLAVALGEPAIAWLVAIPFLAALAAQFAWASTGSSTCATAPPRANLALRAAFIVAIIAQLAPGVQAADDCWQVACGLESRDRYLAARLGGHRALALLNAMYHPDFRVVSEEDKVLHARSRVTAVSNNEDGSLAAAVATRNLAALRSAGFTWFLATDSADADGNERHASAQARWSPSQLEAVAVIAYNFRERTGRVRRYRLLHLENAIRSLEQLAVIESAGLAEPGSSNTPVATVPEGATMRR